MANWLKSLTQDFSLRTANVMSGDNLEESGPNRNGSAAPDVTDVGESGVPGGVADANQDSDEKGNTEFHRACQSGDLGTIERILAPYLSPYLAISDKHGNLDELKLLLNRRNKAGVHGFVLACSKGRTDIVRRLLQLNSSDSESKADLVDVYLTGHRGRGALHNASLHRRPEVVRVLLEYMMVDKDQSFIMKMQDEMGRTPYSDAHDDFQKTEDDSVLKVFHEFGIRVDRISDSSSPVDMQS